MCCDLPARCIEPVCPPATDCFDPIAYDDYLEQQNRRGLDYPIRFSDYLAGQNRRAPAPTRDSRPTPDPNPRPHAARIGDVTPVPQSSTARKAPTPDRLERTLRSGRVIDVFA